jgi:transposase
MNHSTSLSASLSELSAELRIQEADHLPVIAAFCRSMGIREIVNRLVPTEMDLDAGTVVIGMILDTLSGRTPLYRLHEFFKDRDTELLFGTEIAPAAFNDDAVGRVLDRLYDAGTMKIFTEVSLRVCKGFNIRTDRGNFDTTSVNVWGDYSSSTAAGKAPHITYGKSKDKRPDLKQFMFSLLCVEGSIPLVGKVQDGNAADTRLNNEELQRVSELIKATGTKREDFLYIADCKLVTKENLELLGPNPFVTRLPASYNVHDEAIDRALLDDRWEAVGALNQTPQSKKRPAAQYTVCEQSIELYGKRYRAIVVHSTSHDKRRLKRIERKLKEAKEIAQQACAQAAKQNWQCKPDAEAVLRKIERDHEDALWEVRGEVREVKKYARGRPSADGQRKVKSVSYQLALTITENTERVAKFKERAGCFVLLTNTRAPGTACGAQKTYSGRECLEAYKEQSGVERNFSFLKEPLIVNDVFLKKPERIDALGMVLLFSLLVWSLMERIMRVNQREQKLELKDLDNKPTLRPTSFIMTHQFHGILVIRRGNERCMARRLGFTQGQYLLALGLSATIFTKPPRPPSRG